MPFQLNKKNAIISIIILAVVLLAGFFIFKYKSSVNLPSVQNSAGGAETQNSQQSAPKNPSDQNQQNNTPREAPQVQLQPGSVQAEGASGGGNLTVCQDKCGDNVCQKTDLNCKANSMNCICPETPQDCPQDCK